MNLVEYVESFSGKKGIGILMKSISESTYFEGVKFLGYEFKEIYNDWYHGSYDDDEDEEDLIEFNGSIKIKEEAEHKLKYIISWDTTEREILNNEMKDLEIKISKNNEQKLFDMLTNIEKYKDYLFFNGKVELRNRSGFNDDERGSNFCLVDIPFHESVTMTNPTLKDIVNMFYKIKSHKFDKWYEMYSSTKIIRKTKNVLILDIEFDHGS